MNTSQQQDIAPRHTELHCAKCDHRWVAKTEIKSRGFRVSVRPGSPSRRGMLSAQYNHIHTPSQCSKCGKGYSGVVGPRVVQVNGEAH